MRAGIMEPTGRSLFSSPAMVTIITETARRTA